MQRASPITNSVCCGIKMSLLLRTRQLFPRCLDSEPGHRLVAVGVERALVVGGALLGHCV